LRADPEALVNSRAAYRDTPWMVTWAQSVSASARQFDNAHSSALAAHPASASAMPTLTIEQAIFGGRAGAALVTIERSMNGVHWTAVGADAADCAGQKLRLRSIYNDASARDYATGQMQSSWTLRPETRIAAALRDWSKPLREAIKVTLKRVGNMVRQSYVKAKLQVWANGRLLRTYGVWKGSSYLESYWFCSDVAAARRLLKARVGCWGDEASTRHIPRGVLPRIER
jgi:hypothetical protein